MMVYIITFIVHLAAFRLTWEMQLSVEDISKEA